LRLRRPSPAATPIRAHHLHPPETHDVHLPADRPPVRPRPAGGVLSHEMTPPIMAKNLGFVK